MAENTFLNLDEISKNPNNKVKIFLGINDGKNPTVEGFITSNTRLSGGNSYNTPLDNSFTDSLSSLASNASQSANNLGVTNNAQFILKSQVQTVLQWSGSERFSFNVEVLFLSWKIKERNVLRPVKRLLEAVSPLSTGIAGVDALSLLNLQTIAPLGYTALNVKGVPVGIGLSSVSIGKWFKADQLVIKNVDLDVSKETLKDGTPLYCTATVHFETFKMLSALEVTQFIRLE